MDQQQVAEQPQPDAPQQQPEEDEEKSGDEFDTDLEDDVPCEKHGPSLVDLYLQACRRTGTFPVQCFLRSLGQPSLNLSHYSIGPLAMKALAMVLQHDNNVTSLELEDNRLGVEGAHYVVEMLQLNTKINSLNLSNNDLRVEGAHIMSKMMSNNDSVRSIQLSDNGFDDTSAKYFADALKGDYVIKELDLSHNKFSATGGEHLGGMLAGNLGIEVLNLSWNNLNMKGAVALCAGLKVNSTLKQLLLVSNGFSSFVAESLSQALKVNSTLVLLDLRQNLIDDHAVSQISTGLAVNGTLKILKLSHNFITSAGALALLKAVKNNTRSALEDIDLSTVVVCEAFVECLRDIRRRSPAIAVHYTVLPHISNRLSALPEFKKYLSKHKESLMESFRAVDKDGTNKISTADFRSIIKSAGVPLDHNQIVWLVRKFDPQCTASISYRSTLEPLTPNSCTPLSAASSLSCEAWAHSVCPK